MFGNGYKTKYYEGKQRYYYRVVVKALDASNNSSGDTFIEDEGYICLWAESDKPKGLIDITVGTEVSKGTPFPVDFYDDDSILWAYTGLLTREQWIGEAEVAPGVTIDVIGANESVLTVNRLKWLKERLTGRDDDDVTPGGTAKGKVYNWNFAKHGSTAASDEISELIKDSSLDEKLVYVQTTNSEADCGDYVLFTLVADKKLTPHDGKGPEFTNRDGWQGRAVQVRVKDENAPLIVFDTDKKLVGGEPSKLWCPEENTFPDPLIDGEYFDIYGYTLRENGGGGNNYVAKFRMAWIPANMQGGADRYISAVQKCP